MKNVLVRGGDESLEQRMRLVRLALEFGMKLARHKKRMVFEFDDFNEFAVGRIAAENETGLFEFFTIRIIEFITMPMAFVNDKRAIEFGSFCVAHQAWR